MKKTLMATVAAAALFAGTSLAMAEGATKDQGSAKSGASEMHRGGAEMNKSAESKGAAESKSHAQTTGQGAGMENRAESRSGKSEHKAESKEMKRSGQAESKELNRSKMGQAEHEKGGKAQRTGQAEQKGSRSTTGQGSPSESKSQMSKEGSATNKNQAQELNKSQSPSNQTQSAQGRSSTTTGQGAATSTQAGGAVNLTSQQKTELRTSVIAKSGAPKVSRSQINFNLAVGTVVPRSGVVHFVDVGEPLIRIHPAWRGYKYFVVDEEIIVVDPHSYEIVAVIDV